MSEIKNCAYCSNEFESFVSHGKYCSRTCNDKDAPRRKAERQKLGIQPVPRVMYNGSRSKRQKSSSEVLTISPGTLGATSELLVSVDLMQKGYSVFRSLSPNSPFDLVAHKGDELLKIEVKTSIVTSEDRPVHLRAVKHSEHDTLALVAPIPTGFKIEYMPPLELIQSNPVEALKAA
jgi:hypothetical protein